MARHSSIRFLRKPDGSGQLAGAIKTGDTGTTATARAAALADRPVEMTPAARRDHELLTATMAAARAGDGNDHRASALPAGGNPWGTIEDSIDQLAHTITNTGPLTRGIANRERRAAYEAWDQWANDRWKATGDPRYAEFAGGLAAAAIALMSDKDQLGSQIQVDIELNRWETNGQVDTQMWTRATAMLHRQRCSTAAREEWRKRLKNAPSLPAWRGMAVAAAALSGTDSWWGFRTDPHSAVHGTDDTPDI